MLGAVTGAGGKSVNRTDENIPALVEFGSPGSSFRADGFLPAFAVHYRRTRFIVPHFIVLRRYCAFIK